MSFFADNRTRQRLALDALTGQEPPLKRLRSVLGPDPPALGDGSALGLGLGLGLGRPVPHGSSLLGSDARAWPLRAGLDPHMLTASGLPGSLGPASLAMPSSASGFIERNLSALGPSQVMALKDLGMLQAHPLLPTAGAGAQLLAPDGSHIKTKLCRHFIENSCRYQGLCKYAHSVEELKKLPDVGDVEGKALLERYKAKAEGEKQSGGPDASTAAGSVVKTKLCKHFIYGTCIFKEGCRYAHSIEDLKELPDESDEAEKALFEIYKAKFSTPSDVDQQQKSIQTPADASAATATKTMLCKQYIIDNCKLGDSCTFAHSVGELVSLPAEDDVAGKILLELYQSKKEVQKPQQSVSSTAVAPAMSEGAEKTVALDAQTTQKPESLSNVAAEVKMDDKSVRFLKTRMCKHFLVGACKYNKNCTFAHSIEELQPPSDGVKTNPALSSPSQPVQAAQQVDAKQNETLTANKDDKQGLLKAKPCRFFSEGTCRFGNTCNFSHNDQLLGTSGSTLQAAGELKPMYKTRLCNLWEKDKTCSYGSGCHFAHGAQELRQRTGPVAPVSNSMTYGALDLEALARAQQLALPTSGPYSYNVTDTNWRPYRGPEEGIHGLGGAAAEALHYRGLLGDYGQLEQAGSLASLSSLGGANVGLGANIFTNVPSWSTR